MKFLPLEFYILVAPAVIFFFSWIAYDLTHGWILLSSMPPITGKTAVTTLFGESVALYLLLFLFCYLAFKFIYSIARSPIRDAFSAHRLQKVRSAAFVFICILTAFVAIDFAAEMLGYNIRPERVILYGNILAEWEYSLFGRYLFLAFPAFFSNAIVGGTLLMAYQKLLVIIGFLIVFLILVRPAIFRKFIFSFVIAGVISFPIWMLMPAISPDLMFRKNYFSLEVSPAMANELSELKMSPSLENFVDEVGEFWMGTDGKKTAVTTFPSMHVAWSLIILFYGVAAYWPLVFVLFPWALLNGLATVYTLQHYALDVPAGIIVGLIALWITKILVDFEKGYFTDKYKLHSLYTMTEKDSGAFIREVKATFEKIGKR